MDMRLQTKLVEFLLGLCHIMYFSLFGAKNDAALKNDSII